MSSRAPLWATLVATSFGAGFVPKAPGHSGTLTAVPMAWALSRGGNWLFAAGIVVVTVVGTWAAEIFGRASGKPDDQRIVVDEVAGYLLTLSCVPRTWINLLCGFLLFRLFDVVKPPPIKQIDRHVHGGVGVMLDDLIAGVFAGAILFALQHYGITQMFAGWAGAAR